MTQAVAVRRDGDAFQARIFWRKAACLLDPKSPVTQVGFESGPKGFDDVWVAYAPDRAPNDPLSGSCNEQSRRKARLGASFNAFSGVTKWVKQKDDNWQFKNRRKRPW